MPELLTHIEVQKCSTELPKGSLDLRKEIGRARSGRHGSSASCAAPRRSVRSAISARILEAISEGGRAVCQESARHRQLVRMRLSVADLRRKISGPTGNCLLYLSPAWEQPFLDATCRRAGPCIWPCRPVEALEFVRRVRDSYRTGRPAGSGCRCSNLDQDTALRALHQSSASALETPSVSQGPRSLPARLPAAGGSG